MGISYSSVYAAMAAMDDADFIEKSRTPNAEARTYVYETLQSKGLSL